MPWCVPVGALLEPPNGVVGKILTVSEELKKLSKDFSRRFLKETFFRRNSYALSRR